MIRFRSSLRLIAFLLPVGSPALAAEPVTLVVVHKAERVLELKSNDTTLHRVAFVLGGSPVGHKEREGDGRTPEGRYVLDWRNSASGYHRSLHISYPSAADLAQAKAAGHDPGGMIMIHGQRNYFGWLAPLVQYFDWTNGCIAVTNSDMDTIWDIVSDGTPIEIEP